MIDVAIAIDGESVNVTLKRKPSGSYNADGDFVPGSESLSTVRAAIQPASGRQLMDVPEGIRAEARWLAWSRTEIVLDDIITHAGDDYRVMFRWPRAEGGFYRAALGLLA